MEEQLVVFTLASESYGVAIDKVREIIRLSEITRLPKLPPGVLGVIHLRGRVIPIVSLRERFGFPVREADGDTRIVVSDVNDQTVGFVVDAVTEVLRLDEEAIENAPPTTAAGVDASFIKGVGKHDNRLIILLSLDRVVDFTTLSGAVAGEGVA